VSESRDHLKVRNRGRRVLIMTEEEECKDGRHRNKGEGEAER
jgi:hypothetical protein